MPKADHNDHHLITVYDDWDDGIVQKTVSRHIPEKDTRILCPTDDEALAQAARNSSLILICVDDAAHRNVRLARFLKEERTIFAEVIAITRKSSLEDIMKIQAKGFSVCVPLDLIDSYDFEKIIKTRLKEGGKRLSSMLIEEEFRQFSEALSNAPISIVVFDQDKRIVFVSEHYYRAYPKSAQRLIRGLSVFEAFEMMSSEEQLLSNDPEDLERLKRFWYSLSGDVEFTLKNQQSYHSRAVPLASGKGTIVTTHNITPYVERSRSLEKMVKRLQEKTD